MLKSKYMEDDENTMDRIEYLKKWLRETDYYVEDTSITFALINALLPSEACAFFDLSFEEDFQIRQYLIKRIANDIRIEYLPEHKTLVSCLCNTLEKKKFAKRNSCASCINSLFDELPVKEQEFILKLFLSSQYKANRERGLKILRHNWNAKYQETVENIWKEYKDTTSLRVILEKFPEEYLVEHIDVFIPHVKFYQLSKLFLRLADINEKILDKLKNVDEISYSYVLTKLNRVLSNKDANEILEKNYKDDRIGLLLWCFGKMKLWDSIVEFVKKYREPLKIASLRKMTGKIKEETPC